VDEVRFGLLGAARIAPPRFAERLVTWALQRPHFQLYGTADHATGATALLDRPRRHLADDLALEGAPS
jgi:hypothetical protein